MNNIKEISIMNFNILSGELIPYCESVISVKEMIIMNNGNSFIDLKFEFNIKYNILKIFSMGGIEYCRNTIVIKYYSDIYAQRKDKINKLLNENQS